MQQRVESRFRRILLVLDPAEGSIDRLDAAIALASRIRADLEGLFLEDIDVFRSAQLPFVRQVNKLTGVAEPMALESIERELRARARVAETKLAGAASAFRIKTSFRVVRGKLDVEIRTAAQQTDLLILDRPRRAAPRVRIPDALALANELNRPVCVLGHTAEIGEQVRVLYDGSEGGVRALDVAVSLARLTGATLEVALVPAEIALHNSWEEVIHQVAQESAVDVVVHRMAPTPHDRLPTTWLRQHPSAPVIVNLNNAIFTSIPMRDFLSYVRGPVLLV